MTLGANKVHFEVMQVERSGDQAAVTIRTTAAEDDPALRQSLRSVELMDLGQNKVYPMSLVDTGKGKSIAATSPGTKELQPDKPSISISLFPAPSGDHVDLFVPFVGWFTNLPVTDVDELPTLEDLGLDGDLVQREPWPLEEVTVAYDQVSTTTIEGDQQTVTLAADVLFAPDSDQLSDEAIGAVNDVAAQATASAASGAVEVLGHTDDVASDEYNLDLSQRRADVVAQTLRTTLGDAYTVTAVGKGESEPLVDDTTEEARAANRRVEIRFTGTAPEAETSTIGAPGSAPKPVGPVVTGNGPVHVIRAGQEETSWDVSATVTRYAGHLIGQIQVTQVHGNADQQITSLFGSGYRLHEQNYGIGTNFKGPFQVTLLTDRGWLLPTQYLEPPANPKAPTMVNWLGERDTMNLSLGESVTYNVVWPDPGTDTVDIDVRNTWPDATAADGRDWRLEDVPVTR